MAEINVLKIFLVEIVVTVLNGLALWNSIGSLSIGVESEPLSGENDGPIRKCFLDSSPWRGRLAPYLDIFSGFVPQFS